jgi:phenylacetate-coenzyme A ligase PaaK-like adenylate-forming protein
MQLNTLKNKIFGIQNDTEFNEIALEIFRYQYNNNHIYKQFIDINDFKISEINHYKNIPFLPIEFFKTHKILSSNIIPEIFFESSGTSGMTRSRHYISNINLYEKSFLKSFETFFGNIANYCLIALLPNYQEQKNSSLIYMINKLITATQNNDSGFYLYNLENLANKLIDLKEKKQKTILFGVTYALLDLAEKFPVNIPEAIIFETGGMKGRRKEMIREELHNTLKTAFKVNTIHGEYGMTELLSQAYSKENGRFYAPKWMKILIRETNDPFSILDNNKTGGINIIDLANIESCSFIATQDLGIHFEDGSFEISGRFDNSDIRGCNLMHI